MEQSYLNSSSKGTQYNSNFSKNEVIAVQPILDQVTENTKDKPLMSIVANGLKIIHNQAMLIEKNEKQLQLQEIEIEKLQAELKNTQKNQEQNQKKPTTPVSTTSTNYTYEYRDPRPRGPFV